MGRAGGERDWRVVPQEQPALLAAARRQLVELEPEQSRVGAQLHHESGDLVGDPAGHLQPLRHGGDVPQRGAVLDLQRRQRRGGLILAPLVPLQRAERLMRAGEQRGGVLQHIAVAIGVDGDHAHRLADGDHRQAGLARHPLRGAVPGAGLGGGQARVGHELHAGPQDRAAVPIEHDRAIHLGQLAQPGRGELRAELEAARADLLHRRVVAEHDERPGVTADDALQAVAQLGPRRDHRKRGPPPLIPYVAHRQHLPTARWPDCESNRRRSLLPVSRSWPRRSRPGCPQPPGSPAASPARWPRPADQSRPARSPA